jgi:hypothetical protein
MAKKNVASALETLRRVLAEIDWEISPADNGSSYIIDFGPPHVPVSELIAAVDQDAECFLLLVNLSPPVSSERRDEVARYVNSVNWDLMIGNFEMNHDDGRVRFRSSVDFRGGDLKETTLRRTILSAMEIVEAHAEKLVSRPGLAPAAVARPSD